MYMQPRGDMQAENNRPPSSPVPSSASGDDQRQSNLQPQHASIARATSVHASRCESRVRGGHGAMETGEQRRRKRDAHVTPFAQSDVDAKGPKPDHPTGPYAAGHDSGWR